MMDQPDNIILRLLQDMREETKAFRAELVARDEKTQAQIGILAEGMTGLRADVKRISRHMQEIAMAIDHHTTRLDAIEHHLGLNQPKH